ncbi:MAG: GNAT family protein [Candidatus Hermodarchaeota archaeon]|nr:GNAT family protein [Candidatus Hermodarchaeota archaeon]
MIRGKRITLRGLELNDVEIILEHFNDVDVRRYLGMLVPISKEEETEWIRRGWEARKQGTEHRFGVEVNENQQLIGTCSLFDISSVHRKAELGIAIWNKQFWNKGYGQETLKLLLCYGFNFLNLHSIFLLVNSDNERAIHAYEKVGFTHTGKRREAVYQDGAYLDLLIMDILEQEFRELHPNVKLL